MHHQPTLNGTGTAGDIIKVYDGGVLIGSTTVGGDGKWSFTPSGALPNGSHDITATATDSTYGAPHVSSASGTIRSQSATICSYIH